MAEKEIGRQHRIAIMGAAHGLVPGVFHEAIAFVHEDDRWKGTAAGRIGEERRHSVDACNFFSRDDGVTAGHLDSPVCFCRWLWAFEGVALIGVRLRAALTNLPSVSRFHRPS